MFVHCLFLCRIFFLFHFYCPFDSGGTMFGDAITHSLWHSQPNIYNKAITDVDKNRKSNYNDFISMCIIRHLVS